VKRRDSGFETLPAGAEVPPDLMAVLMADFPTPKFTGSGTRTCDQMRNNCVTGTSNCQRGGDRNVVRLYDFNEVGGIRGEDIARADG
jgi:hypothetical protein